MVGRFRREGDSLWVRVIKSILGTGGGMGEGRALGGGDGRGSIGGKRVVCQRKGCGLMARGVGNGSGLERSGDKWRWSLCEDGEFAVKDLSRMVEEKILCADSGGQETRWTI
ncbi:hypothetical protein Tco_1081510 [Tanacetum coccineum]|uniref:Uncharacterized protein n=1 Tax=Tanacetum coccineum TaxID=301880 RepID=A0ABQ5HXS8_9ASTR